jgi:hypothetical protein
MWRLLIDPQPCEPAPCQMHAQFLDQLALTCNAIQVADQQDAQNNASDRELSHHDQRTSENRDPTEHDKEITPSFTTLICHLSSR